MPMQHLLNNGDLPPMDDTVMIATPNATGVEEGVF